MVTPDPLTRAVKAQETLKRAAEYYTQRTDRRNLEIYLAIESGVAASELAEATGLKESTVRVIHREERRKQNGT